MVIDRTTRAVLSLIICLAFVATAVGCGGAPKRHISFHKKHSRSRYVVRGQSHQKPPKTHKGMFIWPLDDFTFMSGFGIRRGRRHDGIDIATKSGTPIKAAAEGQVVFSGRMRGYGNLILLKHKNNYFTAYAHNRMNLVKKGKEVKQGQVIAQVGRTGRATGNHVHFEVRQGQRAMDPIHFLPARAGVLVKKSSKTKKAKVAAKSKVRRKQTKSKKRSAPIVVKKGATKAEKIRAGVAAVQQKPKATTPGKKAVKTTVAKKSKISSKKPAKKKIALKESGKAMSNK